MPAFKRRTKAEKRNRLKSKLARQIAHKSGFPARSRNHLRQLQTFLTSLERLCLIETAFTDSLKALIVAFRQVGLKISEIKTTPFLPDTHHEFCLSNPETQRDEEVRHEA